MEVSSQINNYQTLNSYQKRQDGPVTIPAEPKPEAVTASPEDVYKASNGNLIIDKDGNLSLTAQGQLNVSNAVDAKETAAAEETQAQKDEVRGVLVDYTAAQSKKSQIEIALAVATDGEVEYNSNDTAVILESLRDVQKQNNAVQAYATYKENQNSSMLGLIA